MFDVIVIGGGPAGMAAAVYLARQKLSFLVLTGNVGGQALWSSDVENYLGFHLLDGVALVEQFQKHLRDYQKDFALKEGEEVTKVERIPSGFRVVTAQGTHEGRTLLLASGTKYRTLDVPGEKEFYGKGVTYCAACDAPLFREKIVFVIGGGNSAMDAALFAEKYAIKVVIVSVNPSLNGDDVMLAKIRASKKIETRVASKVVAIEGEKMVKKIRLMGPDGGEQVESVDGVFIEIGLTPVSGYIDFVAKDKWGQVMVDKFNATNVERIWAAGDVTDITEKQISIAVGEGSKAALSIIEYFQTHHL